MTDFADRVEHTVLGPTTTWAAVQDGLEDALQYGMRACIPPSYVADATDYAPTVDLTTVVGFPHGQHATAVKVAEAREAWEDGAAEVDVVAHLGHLLDGDDEAVRADLAEVVAAVPIPVKVIVEAPLLEPADLRRACQAAADADAAFVKTATGFSEGGATVEDVEVMAEYLPVKASGGVGSWARAEALLAAGADRIGASSGVTLVEEYREATEEAGSQGEQPADGDQSGEMPTDDGGDES
ncbi:deoxyribose-phosphate aldolase [Halobacteriales archaeon Cl-PHB]